MKKIDTTQVTDPSTLQPFTARSLKFLQDATAEDVAGIIKSIVTSNLGSYSLSVPYVISGCVYSGTTPNFAVTAGEIFYNGKYYAVNACSSFTNIPQFNEVLSQDPTADPVTFSDSSSKNVHNIYEYEATDVVSGGDFDATDFVSLYGTDSKLSVLRSASTIPAVANQATSSTSYIDLTNATYTTPNDGVTRTWLIQGKTSVDFTGGVPINGGKLQIVVDGVSEDISRSLIEITASSIQQYNQSCVCMTVLSVAPNKIVKLQIASAFGASVNFNDNKFTMVEI